MTIFRRPLPVWLLVYAALTGTIGCSAGTPTQPSPIAEVSVASAQSTPPAPEQPPEPPAPEVPPAPTPRPGASTATLVAAGDIGWCGPNGNPAATGALVQDIPGTVVLAGDLAYPDGSARDFANCFTPAWGHTLGRARAVPGNHDYQTPNASAYFDVMGAAAGPGRRGFYSFKAGEWFVLMLDSNQRLSPGSEQYEFVQSELAANRTGCAAAVYHHPLFSSAKNGPNPYLRDLWQLLQGAGVDVVVSSHDHVYERFGKQSADGRPLPDTGIRQFTVGTGGSALYPFTSVMPNSEVRLSTWGVLKLTLEPAGYRWEFIDALSRAVTDSGAAACH